MSRIEKAEVAPIEVSAKTLWQHLVLTDDSGRRGVGEYTLNDRTGELDARALAAANQLVGRHIGADTLAADSGGLQGSFSDWTILSALHQALLDLRSAEAGVPVARLINPTANLAPVPLYANINRRTEDRSPEGFVASARLALGDGFQAMKMAPFDGVTPESCESPDGAPNIDAGLARIRAVADAIAGKADLMVDCHWRFTTARARRLIDELAEMGVIWFECPIPETLDRIPDLKSLRRHCAARDMRLTGLELMTGAASFAPFLDGGAYDVIMPDVKHIGGVEELQCLTEAAKAGGVALSIHSPSGPVAHQFSAHLTAALEFPERMEIQYDESPLFLMITEPAPTLANGSAVLSEASGLGLSLVDSG